MNKWVLFLLLPLNALAQFHADFEEGETIDSTVWSGDLAHWRISEGKLNSNFIHPGGTAIVHYGLKTNSDRVRTTLWEFWVKTKTTSGNNLIRIHLTSISGNLKPEDADSGYIVEIGNTEDHISLCRKDGKQLVPIIEGRAGITENAIFKIKVTCDEQYRWKLYTDLSGSGNQYFPEGTTDDSTYRQSNYFGIAIAHSGKTVNQSHWFDDILIDHYTPDTLPPVLKNIAPISDTLLELWFSETINPGSLLNERFQFGESFPRLVQYSPETPSVLRLSFAQPLQSEKSYPVRLNSIADAEGNQLDTSFLYIHFIPGFQDILFTEIYPIPGPTNGLPEYEYVELYNRSNYPVTLKEWSFCAKSRCKVLADSILNPGQSIILCDQEAEEALSVYGNTMGMASFPALNDNGSTLYLKNEKGDFIDSVTYDKTTFHDPQKSKGGWSLELQNTKFPCWLENWTASTAPIGGTPGQENSRQEKTPVLRLSSIELTDSMCLSITLNAKMTTVHADDFDIPGLTIADTEIDTTDANIIRICLQAPVAKGEIYQISLKDIKNCGMPVDRKTALVFGIIEKPEKGDVYLNEILFNPVNSGGEFVELYNASRKIIDLQDLYLADGRNGIFRQITPLAHSPVYFLPDQYIVITKDKSGLLNQYTVRYPENIIETAKMPSYPNTSGVVALLTNKEQLLDKFEYSEKDHGGLLHERKGVSLEKINPVFSSEDSSNWESASSVYGYATPGFQNSQFVLQKEEDIKIRVEPEVFSPDGDSYDDVTFLKYDLTPGFSGNIDIFNENGRLVRRLKKNILLGTHDRIAWDGRDEHGNLLRTGIYIFFIEFYHPSGKVLTRKLPVTLVKRF